MTNQAGLPKGGVCRRSLIKSVPMIAGAILTSSAVPNRLFAQTKLAHDAVKYQEQPNNGQQCSTCIQFEPPAGCKTVESPISPDGWCALYTPKPT
jgi:hypothetical protein